MPMPKELKQLFLWVPCFIYGIIVRYPQDPILILKAPISQRWIATRTWPGACLGALGLPEGFLRDLAA